MMLRYLILFLAASVIAACDSDSADDMEKPMDDFQRNKAKWQAAAISDYRIQENLSCFCVGLLEWDVVVRDGQKDTLLFDESRLWEGQTYESVFEDARSIEEAFEFIANFETDSVASFVVEYDEQYGFPVQISVDREEGLADDEISYLYSNFEPEQ